MKREYWITRDRHRVKGPFKQYTEAWMQMFHVQGQSVSYAFKHGGWAIEEAEAGQGDTVDYQIQAQVSKIVRKTEGYAATLKVVGITITADYSIDWKDEDVEQTAISDVEFDLPLAFRRAYSIGDTVTFTIERDEA